MIKQFLISTMIILCSITSVAEEIKYAKEVDVREDLDCGTGVSNEVKANNLRVKYANMRIKFTNKIVSVRDDEIHLAGMLGTGVFTGLPNATLRNKNEIKKLQEDKTYTFDCRIVDYCRTRLIMNNYLRFGDCTVSD